MFCAILQSLCQTYLFRTHLKSRWNRASLKFADRQDGSCVLWFRFQGYHI